MRILALDTSTPTGSVALAVGGEVTECRIGGADRTHGERLPGDVTALLAAHDLAPADIDLYAVCSGPGSFTGLRVGLATIQALALVNRRPVVAVPTLEALACAAVWAPAGPERTEVMTATLEVTPAQGERLVLGEREGTLSLAVRSLAPPATGTENGTSAGTSVELKEMLLPPAAYSASQEHLRRERRLNALSMRRQLTEAEQELQAAKVAGATTLETVRIFRGSEPAEEVVFADR